MILRNLNILMQKKLVLSPPTYQLHLRNKYIIKPGRIIKLKFNRHKLCLNETLEMIKSSGGTCYGYVCDLCNREDVYKKAAVVSKEVGRVSILVNNAGIATAMKFLETPDEMLLRTMNVNIISHFWTVKAFLPAMIEANKGHIVTIASLAGHFGSPKLVDYSASKYAAVGFDEALRMELDRFGHDVKTTVVCPYFIRSTGMFDDVLARVFETGDLFIPTLVPDQVAERVVTAMRCNDRVAIIPGYLRMLIGCKWIFPWKCVTMVLDALVHDVSPDVSRTSSEQQAKPTAYTKLEEFTKDPIANGNGIHQQLTRRVSNSERKP
ncbi:hypothetical protein QAD02_018988 [Eretmocerus hayati]|uniref:Uncharacterized protein n=1 Tax=Eretmocerus hayati TaxID=131215 RepID=A0ACC2PIC6_9HYME|nr:hypothetical protein QAD02_018988 [Eretmocerus hayati]